MIFIYSKKSIADRIGKVIYILNILNIFKKYQKKYLKII